jgi:glycerate kinase
VKILIACDKFKGSLTAKEVCNAISVAIQKKFPEADITAIPLADGGEGMCELLTNLSEGAFKTVSVTGPLFEPVAAQYGLSPDGKTAFIEMAKASGLQLVPLEKRNPLYTTTYGTGELIKDAISNGAEKIVLGIGGSATNDAGIGMAEALGFEFFDSKQRKLSPIGQSLLQLSSLSTNKIHELVRGTEFIALCDVDNPLYGPQGAAFIYGPQKGANESEVQQLDIGLRNFEKVIQQELGMEPNFAGAGAGGGIASGVKVFLNGKIRKGIDYVIEATQLKTKIENADLIITGEGKIDGQTLSGKVVQAVAGLGKQFNKKVVAICGECLLSEDQLKNMGVFKVISLIDSSTSAGEALANASGIIQKKITQDESFSV